jgi:hypothetical protein
MSDTTELWITLAVLLACLAAIGLLVRLERRPKTQLSPRLLSTTPVIILSGFIGLLALVHLLNMFGIHTGR